MYAFIESPDKSSNFHIAVVVQNQYGAYRWRYEGNHKFFPIGEQSYAGEHFTSLDDAVGVLREARLRWDNPNRRIVIIDNRAVRLRPEDLDIAQAEKVVEE